jgi:hypothetical protein
MAEINYNCVMIKSLFTVDAAPAIVQDLTAVCHICGFTFSGSVAVRPASRAAMDGSKGLLERVFLVLRFDERACVHLRAMRWLKISKPLRHHPERCDVVLLPLLHNPPPIPGPKYKSLN